MTAQIMKHKETGETGWMVRFGRATFGGVHLAVFSTPQAAQDADVSHRRGLARDGAQLNFWLTPEEYDQYLRDRWARELD